MAGPGVIGQPPLSGSDYPDATQTQRRPPSPHSEDVVQGAELAGLRSGTAPAGQPDVMDRRRGARMLADHGAKRAGSVYGRGDPNQPDAAHGFQAGVTPNRGPDDVGADVDGAYDLSSGPQHGQPPGEVAAGHPGDVGAARPVARIDRQHRAAGLRGGSMAGGETWRQVASEKAQAASGVPPTLAPADLF